MIIVLDTETCGSIGKPEIYDLGYVIADADGNIVKERSYTIKQTYDNAERFKTAYYKEKRPIYERRLESGYAKRVYLGYALYMLAKDMERYEVDADDVYAYNSPFDRKAIRNSADVFGSKHTLDNITDIWKGYADKYITNTQDYIDFCERNGFMTKPKYKTPRPQEKAETLFRYLTGNADYEEEHTALEDSKIELSILIECLRRARV